MTRRALSVTLETDNVTWLKGRAGASGDSVSELLDQIVTAARQSGQIVPARSIAATIDIDDSDPLLDSADAALHWLFDASLAPPLVAREARAKYRTGVRRPRKRRG